MAFEFKIVAVSSAATCKISEALYRCFVKHHSAIRVQCQIGIWVVKKMLAFIVNVTFVVFFKHSNNYDYGYYVTIMHI
jgi:reverse gyrase